MDGGKMKHSSARPKHSTVITVGSSMKSPSKPLTVPLEQRLSGDLSQILGTKERLERERNPFISPVNDDRKKISTWDKHRVVSIKPPAVTSVNSPTSIPTLPVDSPSQPLIFTSSKPTISKSQMLSNEALSSVLPRSSSSEANSDMGVSAVKVNGHDNHSAFDMNFYSSLPSLPSDDLFVQRYSSPSLIKTSGSASSKSRSRQPVLSHMTDRKTTSAPKKTKPAAVSNLSPIQTLTPNSKHPEPTSQTSRKSSRPPPMKGIAENGGFDEETNTECQEIVFEMPPEKFYVDMKNYGESSKSLDFDEEEPTFVGRRDVRDTKSLKEKQIVSAKGTVRGFKNRVRAGIATFIDQASNKFNYRALEKGKIVVYTTSVTVVRETHERCKTVRNILQNHMVRFEQRDVYMSQEHQRQIRERLDMHREIILPQIFIDGIHLGGAADLEKLNESGELRTILQNFPKIQLRTVCDSCGGYRFVPCVVCHGSKKSVHRNNFTEEFCALRCMHCNENGLQRCQDCLDQLE